MKIEVYSQIAYCPRCTRYFSRDHVKDQPALPCIVTPCADCMTPAELTALKAKEPYFKYDKGFRQHLPNQPMAEFSMVDNRSLAEI